MALSQVVARYRDGRIVRGTTANFFPNREEFHVQTPEGELEAVSLADLKAVFFVRDLVGDPKRSDAQEPSPMRPTPGRKIRVEFADGEILQGTTQGYQPSRSGFFLFPADAASNNERCFVITAATRRVEPL
jgi:hypothetical protein